MDKFTCRLEDLPRLLEEHATLRKKSVRKAVRKSAERLKAKIEANHQDRAGGDPPEDGRIPVVTGRLLDSGAVTDLPEGAALTYTAPYAEKVERRRHFVRAAMVDLPEIIDQEVRKALGKKG